MDQQTLSVMQFGNSATRYLTSAVHTTGADLVRLTSVAEQERPVRVLDLAY